jgi:hypothetical protein
VIVNFIKNEFSVDERVMKQLAYHHSLAWVFPHSAFYEICCQLIPNPFKGNFFKQLCYAIFTIFRKSFALSILNGISSVSIS